MQRGYIVCSLKMGWRVTESGYLSAKRTFYQKQSRITAVEIAFEDDTTRAPTEGN